MLGHEFTTGRRRSAKTTVIAVLMAALLAIGMVSSARPAKADTLPTVVLDPDWANVAHANWGGTTYTALALTQSVASQVAAQLPSKCQVQVQVTHQVGGANPTPAQRFAQMQGAQLSLTLAMDALVGTPWDNLSSGDPTGGGGTKAFYPQGGNARDGALASGIVNQVATYTGRPIQGVNNATYEDTFRPDPTLSALPGPWAEAWLLFIDNNFDAPAAGVTTGDYSLLVNAVGTTLVNELKAEGVQCGSAFPSPPTAAQLAALYALGFANWMRYGSDPVNFATGNFTESDDLFTVSGPGGTSTPVNLSYNSADPRSGRFGNGWSSTSDVRSQTFTDKSVLITTADGQAVSFAANADGSSFTATEPGIYESLKRTATHTVVLTAPDGSTQTFSEDQASGAGVEAASTDRAGRTWTYGYGAASQTVLPAAVGQAKAALVPLTSITDPGGQTITFTNDVNGRVSAVTRPDGASYALRYDSAGNLVVVTDPNGHATRYGYDSSNRMITVTAPDGVTYVTNTYDAQGRVVSQRNGDGSVSTITYNANSTTTYADTTGAKTTFTMDSSGRVTKVVTPLNNSILTGYKNADTTVSTDADGHSTNYAYDSAGNLVSQTDPTGAQTKYAYTTQSDLAASTGPDGRTTTYTVDPHGNTTAIAGPDGAHWQQTFDAVGDLTSRTDPDGHVTRYGYDTHGNLTLVTDANNGVTKLGYDAANRLTSAVDPDGRTTTYGYDAVGNLTVMTQPSGARTTYTYQADDKTASVTDPDGHITRYTYNNGLNIATVTDPDGGVTKYGYDSEYRRTSVTDADGHVTKYAYDAEGNLTSTTDPDGKITTRTYDPAQNLTSITDPVGGISRITYDADNRPVTVTDPRGAVTKFDYDIAGRLVSVTDPLARKTSYAYDAGDRVVSITDPTGAVQKLAYDSAGNQTRSTDADGRVSSIAYDALNQVIATVDPSNAKTAYSYDAAGQLTKVTDPAGRTTAYTYTADGQTASQADGLSDKKSYAYDPAGNITGITDPRGGKVTFAYNGDDQLTKQTNALGAVTSYAYTAAGIESSMTNALGVASNYNHDAAGLLTQVIENATGTGTGPDVKVTSNYTYNANGQLTSTTAPNGGTRTYTRDLDGNIIAATDPLGKKSTYGYDLAGQVTSQTDADGHTTTYAYDADGRTKGIAPAAGTGSAISYSYDANGLLVGMHDGTGTSSWSYTPTSRVASATDSNGKTLTYGYDASGLESSLTYPDATKATYGRDAAGRVTSLTTTGSGAALSGAGSKATSYGYDASGDLTSIARPNNVNSTYTYDAAGHITAINHTAPAGTHANSSDLAAPADPAPASPTPTVQSATISGIGPAAQRTGASIANVTLPPTGHSSPSASVTPAVPTTASGPSTSAAAAATASAANTLIAQSATNPTTTVCGLLPALTGCQQSVKTATTSLPLKLTYSYDGNGDVTGEIQTSNSGTLSSTFGYDKLDRLTSSKRSDGINSTYTYNSSGDQVASTTVDPVTAAQISTTSIFNAADQVTKQISTSTLGRHSTSTTVANAYDNNGNLTTSTSTTTSGDWAGFGALAGPSLSGLFGYGGNGKPLTTTYTYDYANQLTSVTAPDPTAIATDTRSAQTITSTYTRDGLGRAVDQTQGAVHNPSRFTQLDRLFGLPAAGTLLGIDVNGLPCTDPDDTSATCHTDNTVLGGQPTQVTYDGITPVSWSATVTVQVPPGHPLGWFTGQPGHGATISKTRTINVIYGPQGPDSQTDTRYGWSTLELDAIGSVRDVSSPAGATTAAASYTDFGDTQPQPGTHPATSLFGGPITHTGATINHYLSCTTTNGTGSGTGGGTGGGGQPLPATSSVTPLGYTSQPQDPAFNLDLFPDRALSTDTSTWLQPDPHTGALSNPQRLNRYSYVNNNPHTLIDPDGADPAPSAACQASITCTNSAYGCFTDTSNNCWGPGGEYLGTGPTVTPPTPTTKTTSPGCPGFTGPVARGTTCKTPPTNQQGPTQNNGRSSYAGGACDAICKQIRADYEAGPTIGDFAPDLSSPVDFGALWKSLRCTGDDQDPSCAGLTLIDQSDSCVQNASVSSCWGPVLTAGSVLLPAARIALLARLAKLSELADAATTTIPKESQEVIESIRENGVIVQGGVRGPSGPEEFVNDGRNGSAVLPRGTTGDPITYREWGTIPDPTNPNPGGERIVTGSDGSIYYSPDHYNTFIRYP